ncbi:MAG: PASTA domain-containing protein [Ignavibacteria bacterium]|nr:PASTA domain-containing protein [Ignavibacteria bacterium]
MTFYRSTNNRQINSKRRTNLFLLLFIAFFLAVLSKLFVLQILDSEIYRTAAKKQYHSKVILNASRGLIFDKNMNLLVSNTTKVSIAADPNMIDKPDSVAGLLAYIFGKDKQEYLDKLSGKNTSFIYLERKVDLQSVKGLDTMSIEGLIVLKDPSRNYNYGQIGSKILGLIDIENKGRSGLELEYNDDLSGKDGYIVMQKDGRGNKRPDLEYPRKDPLKGNNLVLTVDVDIQKFAEEELESGVVNYNASGGKVLVVSVKTGEILALASYPTYDPNNLKISDTAGFKNSVLTDIYEPGSVFKIVTAAGLIEEHLLDRNSIVQTEGGTFDVSGIKVKDSHGFNSMSFEEIIEQSSNIGVMKIARKLGPEKFYKYARDFGFGIYSGLDLPGENKGYLKRPVDFSSESLEFLAIGYQVMVNAVQLSMAYSAVANDGVLMKPYIVKKIIDPAGNPVKEFYPQRLRQVIQQSTSKELNSFFIGVVQRGTGRAANIENVTIAGKTGTSQRIVDGKYSSGSHNSTFIGYFPAEDPQILITVILDDPKSGEFYGGRVAAPIFRNIAQRIIDYKGVSNLSQPDIITFKNNEQTTEDVKYTAGNLIAIPNLRNLKLDDAVEILKEKKLKYEVIKDDTMQRSLKSASPDNVIVVVDQQPDINESVEYDEKLIIKLITRNCKPDKNEQIKVPDVINLSLRRAINRLIVEGFKVEIVGSGEVITQIPKANTEQKPGTKVILFCRNSD